MLHCPPDDNVDVLRVAQVQPEQTAQLAEHDDEGRGGGQAGDDRTRQQVGHESKLHGPHRNLQEAHHGGDHDGQHHVLAGAHLNDGPKPGRQNQHVEGLRANGKLTRRGEYRVDEKRHEGPVQPVNGRQAGNDGVGHGLGDQHDPYGQARRHVMLKGLRRVVGEPPREGERFQKPCPDSLPH